ncbi:MAG: T9SS type A sorting domain-containing protein [candidate division KSB1 bacterium]|nr:T9SS type A sorting domain-containing protein [candidate division KSB1 bacterium]MDZ7304537.1 T9SS type A sorting domain-containing protein [candidate division KSB1 bacterium]MDZ7313706.1 T9SS type A sorting domain-containing protein [candidate division KSB1 bacterium]
MHSAPLRALRFPIKLLPLFFAIIIGVLWLNAEAYSQNGAPISGDTQSGYLKSNQSKVFYHDGKWWAIARYEPENRWYIWKYDADTWTRTALLNKSATLKYDVILNSTTGKLYVMGSHATASEFWRFSYSSGWTKDSGFAVDPGFLNVDANNPVSLVQAQNGDLWIFRVESNKLQAKRSTDGGATWSAVIDIKTGLTTANGTTDAVAFAVGGSNFVGVAYGEVNSTGSKYGFLYHRDGDPDNTWTDESAALTFFGTERASNNICMTVDAGNNLYLFTQNGNAGTGSPRNTLYKRESAGGWQKYKVNTSADWKSPAITVDGSNNKLYLMGINSMTQWGEYKTCHVGQENTLEIATVSDLFSGTGSTFASLSAPPGGTSVSFNSKLMVCADNNAASDIWYRLLSLTDPTPVVVGAITVASNEVNANATYTVPLTLSANGALAAGVGTINIVFPDNTFVPNGMTAGAILVDGTPCTTVVSDTVLRQAIITTPVNLPGNHSFPVVFNPAAGLLNPSTVGANYQLIVATSVQPTLVNSPFYGLVATTTTVTPATVSLTNTEPDSCANYTLAFNLGSRGRMISGTSTFTVTFNAATIVSNGALTGVKVNGVDAAAIGNSAAKTVTITLPGTVTLGNNAAVTLYLPAPAVCNPSAFGSYTLTVATSIETTPVTSNPYRIIERVAIGAVTTNPTSANANASYLIPLTLAGSGALTAGVDVLGFRFPEGTIVPNNITAAQIIINGTPATTATSNSITREVLVTTPVNLANNQNFSVGFNVGAGLFNPPAIGDYTLQAWTSVQPTPATSPIYSITPSLTGSPISTLTKSGFKKSNQSKVFYHDNQWWAIAYEELENKWYIWKFDGTLWTKAVGLDKGTAYHCDAVVNATANKLYLFSSHKSSPNFRSFSYIGGAWQKDTGFPVKLLDFPNLDTGNPVSLVQAKNGDLWIFRIDTNRLQAKRSSDGGLTWSAIINLKTGLNTANGTTDAVAFTDGSTNYVGVAYGETDSPSPKSQFGFLRHQDGAPDNVWTDESGSLTFFGNERAINNLSMTTDASDNVYLFTRNQGGSGSDPRNTLYKRGTGGIWNKYKVNLATTYGWKTPALAVDVTNNIIYLMGVNLTSLAGEYKACPLGQEATLDTVTARNLFAITGSFEDLSVPAANVTAASGLMVCGDNVTANDIYYRHFHLGGALSLIVGAITVTSNEVNANATYTIPLTLSSNGVLDAGTGVLNFAFPNNTYVPNNMPAAAVRVDGVPATSVISNNATRQVSVTTPVNLPNNHSFFVVFDSTSGAGLLNPTLVGANYRLTCWTSAQPTQVKSPFYSLLQATTQVTPATVTPFPTDPDSIADYTIKFNLGAHGRLLAGNSTIMVKFDTSTHIIGGPISGAKINNTNVTATADAIWRKITFSVPLGMSLTNNVAVTLFIPKPVVRNPILPGSYTLLVSTSVETTAVASLPYDIKINTAIGAPIPGTKKSFDRNNQSKMFYHGGSWWVTAQSKTDLKWYLWKYNGLFWTQGIQIHTAAKNRPDCILDASSNKVYILLPGSSTTYITRLNYSGGNWTVDSGYPYTIANFAQGSDRGLNLVRAKNGDFWVFDMRDSTLVAKRSSDQGKTWSATITLKAHLHNSDGLTDAVAFTYGGSNYIGVGYAENSAPGSIYGFLRHKDSDPDSLWTDETASIPQFAGTTSDDHISMAVHGNEVLMIIKTNGGGPTTTNIGLLRRLTNGTWNQYPILLSEGWTRPLLAIDESGNKLHVIGTREGPIKIGEMKKVTLGDYNSLLSAPLDTIFMNEAENFFDASVAAHPVNGTMNLLVCNGNETRDELWYNLILLGGAPKQHDEAPIAGAGRAEADFEGVQVFPNPFNPQTSFRFKVKENAPVKLQIFNISGQLVRTIVDADLAPGVYLRRWNGRSQDGRPVASGVYFYRLLIGQQALNGRIQLLK